MIPTNYVNIDNDLITSIFQVRNDGRIDYDLTLKIDINQYLNGVNIIDCLILEELIVANAFETSPYDYFEGSSLVI
jgi:hypothetical protein